MNEKIERVDYLNCDHAKDLVFLMDTYASDPMGGSKALAEEVKVNLVSALARLSQSFSVISYVDGRAVGLINCFEAFSTFSCKPLVNIHDVIVLEKYRGRGLSHKMLKMVEDIAVSKGCCKLTLEVLEGNAIAKSAYNKFGFSDYELDPKMGKALFWQKLL